VVTESHPDWVFLTYRLPREPSAPRLALWRAARRLGALQASDGLLILPHSFRNLEHMQWLAAEIRERDGMAAVWLARADSARDHATYVATMRAAIDEEYGDVSREADQAVAGGGSLADSRRVVRRLRGRLRRIAVRDYFDAPSGPPARAAVDRLARDLEVVPA
jgi:Protein ChrB, N-terminal